MNPLDTFSAYFDAFEACLIDDHWQRLTEYFAEDLSYTTAERDVITGKAAVIDYLEQAVNTFDRRFSQRAFVGEPNFSQENNQVTMNFTAKYQRPDAPDLIISGTEVATVIDGKIATMVDHFSDDTVQGLDNWMTQYGSLLESNEDLKTA